MSTHSTPAAAAHRVDDRSPDGGQRPHPLDELAARLEAITVYLAGPLAVTIEGLNIAACLRELAAADAPPEPVNPPLFNDGRRAAW